MDEVQQRNVLVLVRRCLLLLLLPFKLLLLPSASGDGGSRGRGRGRGSGRGRGRGRGSGGWPEVRVDARAEAGVVPAVHKIGVEQIVFLFDLPLLLLVLVVPVFFFRPLLTRTSPARTSPARRNLRVAAARAEGGRDAHGAKHEQHPAGEEREQPRPVKLDVEQHQMWRALQRVRRETL